MNWDSKWEIRKWKTGRENVIQVESFKYSIHFVEDLKLSFVLFLSKLLHRHKYNTYMYNIICIGIHEVLHWQKTWMCHTTRSIVLCRLLNYLQISCSFFLFTSLVLFTISLLIFFFRFIFPLKQRNALVISWRPRNLGRVCGS